MAVASAKAKRKISYVWWVAAAILMCYTCSTGIGWTSTMIFPFLEKEMGWTAATLGMFIAIRSYIGIIWAPAAGQMTNWLGNRKAMLIGIVVQSVGVLLYTTINSSQVWLLVVYWPIIMAYGQWLAASIGVTSLPRKWFIKHSALVQGMMGSFWGVTSSVIFPSMSIIAAELGWRNAIFIIIPTLGVIFFLTTFFIVKKDTPEEMGLNPDGLSDEEIKQWREASRKATGDTVETAYGVKEALRLPQFYLVMLANFFGGGISVGFVQSYSTLIATAEGVPIALAGLGMTALMIPGIFGRLIIGPIADYWGKRQMIIVTAALSAVTYFLGYFWMHDMVSVFVILGLLGLYMMDDLTLMPPFYGDLFGRKNYPAIMGWLNGIGAILSGTAMWLMGNWFVDYGVNFIFLLLGIGMVCSIITVLFIKPTKVERANMAFQHREKKQKQPAA